MAYPRVDIRSGDFDLSEEVETLRANDKRIGAICTFTGTVRDRNDGRCQSVKTRHRNKVVLADFAKAHVREDQI